MSVIEQILKDKDWSNASSFYLLDLRGTEPEIYRRWGEQMPHSVIEAQIVVELVETFEEELAAYSHKDCSIEQISPIICYLISPEIP